MQSFLGRHVRSGVMVLFWLILLLLGFQVLSGNGRSKNGLDAYESFSTKDHFAIVEDLPKGASLFFGTIDGQASVKVMSSKQLSSPFIVDGSRLLFVEATATPSPRFDLLELHIFGPSIWCNRLVSSDQYIAGPVVMAGKHASEILFFSGRYNPESSGNTVHRRHLAAYQDGQVSIFSGPTFSSIHRLAQMDDDRFLGASYSFDVWNEDGTRELSHTDLTDNSWLAEGRIVGQALAVKPAAIGRLKIEAVSEVTSNPKGDLVVVRSADFSKPGSRTKFTIIENSQIESTKSFLLPRELDADTAFVDRNADGKSQIRVITVNNEEADRKNSAFIVDYVNAIPENSRLIKLDAASVFDTKNCRAK